MNLFARTPSFVSSSTSVSPEKRYYGKQDLWKSVVAEDRSGRLNQETERFSSTNDSNLDDDRAWATSYDRSGRPDKTSWRVVQKVRPDHEEFLLDGTAQSVRNGETLRDRSGEPDSINSQEVASSHNFDSANKGSDEANDVSTSLTEIISLDSGLRLDGLLALELWDLIVSVLWKRLSNFRVEQAIC